MASDIYADQRCVCGDVMKPGDGSQCADCCRIDAEAYDTLNEANKRLREENTRLRAQLDYIQSCQTNKGKNPGDELLELRALLARAKDHLPILSHADEWTKALLADISAALTE